MAKSRHWLYVGLIVFVLGLVGVAVQAEETVSDPVWAVEAVAPAATPTGNLPPKPPQEEPVGDEPAQDEAIDAAWLAWEELPADVQAKVDPRILAEFQGQVIPVHHGGTLTSDSRVMPAPAAPLEQTRFLVYLKAKANLQAVTDRVYASQVDQRTAVFDALVQTAQSSQAMVRSVLDAKRAQGDVATYQPFYVVNAFAVDGDLATVVELAQRGDVERLVANYPLVPIWEEGGPAGAGQAGAAQVPLPTPTPGLPASTVWNIRQVAADRVWEELHITGHGAVVGGFDTGVNYTHEALYEQYRGYVDGRTVVNDYNWFEPDTNLYPDGNLGPSLSSEPYDCHFFGNHGTHTMGTMVGAGDTPSTRVGMAPNARWIAVPGICPSTTPGGIKDDIGAIKAFQWFLCPTDLSGDLATADCTKAPDVINNSWGSANPVDDTFRPIIQVLRAAGVAPVFAAGNPSAGSGSIGSPAHIPEAIAVGATDSGDSVASFSGRGPSFIAGEQKPELTAPGVSVKSTVGNGEYTYYSGTSMAAPHVAGLIALMVAADLQDGVRDFNVDELEQFMASTAVDLGEPGPDDEYGYGRIDAYHAVQWVLSAGDLQGRVQAATDGAPVVGATVTGASRTLSDTFHAVTAANGTYSVTVPAGAYDVTVGAWGYYSSTFSGQRVVTNSLSIEDFSLTPLPTAALRGVVRSGGAPVPGASIYPAQHPAAGGETGSDGSFALELPVGSHEIVVEAAANRILHTTVTIGEQDVRQDLMLVPAPTILLVDASAYAGWFDGWPIAGFFQWALDVGDYQYDQWSIQYLGFNDTQPLLDGTTGYGVPSAETLGAYDIVIWTQSGCVNTGFGCLEGGTPANIGADDELIGYLDGGGRLFLSGQDMGDADDKDVLYDAYLHADRTTSDAAYTGDVISGTDFLDGLALEITNASLYGFPNGGIYLSPDGVVPQVGDGESYSVLDYGNGNGAAGLAVAPCTAAYRAFYLAVGYENIAPRGYQREPAMSELIDRSLVWLMDGRQPYGVSFVDSTSDQVGEPGTTVNYEVQVINTGSQALSIEVTVRDAAWPVEVLSDSEPVTSPFELAPCAVRTLSLAVSIPEDAKTGATDTAVFRISAGQPDLPTFNKTATTSAFPFWHVETPLPTERYRLGAVAASDDATYYAIGGWADMDPFTGLPYASSSNERYNACTGEWTELAHIPLGLANLGIGALGGKIYLVGGDGIGPSGDYYLSDRTFVYDPATDTWAEAAPLPVPLAGTASATANGKLYLFGGYNAFSDSNRTLEYDPETDTWSERASMPLGTRTFAAAAELNGRIYVVGGWPNLRRVEVYDPATDTWSTAATPETGRQSPGLVAAPDGYLYLFGGGLAWEGLSSAERYQPATDSWTAIASLNDSSRAGVGGAYTAGKLFAAGGPWAVNSHESLQIAADFCQSGVSAQQMAVKAGDPIDYSVTIAPSDRALPGASFSAPIPAGTTFAGFGNNPLGAAYNSAENRVEWSGSLSVDQPVQTVSYSVKVAPGDWPPGQRITHTVTFDSGAGNRFVRQAISGVFQPDFSVSEKRAGQDTIRSGEALTYTLHLESASPIGGQVSLHDALPPGTTYLPDSLSFSDGSGRYDAATDTIIWSGAVSAGENVYVNLGDNYSWGDSAGGGVVPNVDFDWIDVSQTGQSAGRGDDLYICNLPIGFDFEFYGVPQSTFCVDTNGYLSFDSEGHSIYSNSCPLPRMFNGRSLIAALWSDLIVGDGIYYQTLGTSPNRYLVVQWSEVFFYSLFGDTLTMDFEIVLHENGLIKVQILRAGLGEGAYSTTGLENASESLGVTYACNTANSLQDKLAVLFVSPGTGIGVPNSDIVYAVSSSTQLPANATIVNTAVITAPEGTFERSVSTRINPIDLSSSSKEVSAEQIGPGEEAGYRITLRNTGLVTAAQAILTDTLPADIVYVPDSLRCSSGTCTQQGATIAWQGDIPPGDDVTIAFTSTLVTVLPDKTPVTNVARVNDGSGLITHLSAAFVARRAYLGASFVEVTPRLAEPGGRLTYTFFVRNNGTADTLVALRHELPAQLAYVDGSLTCGRGTCSHDAGTVSWEGVSPARSIVPVQFDVTVAPDAERGAVLDGRAIITDRTWDVDFELPVRIAVARALFLPHLDNGQMKLRSPIYLPLVNR